MRWLVATLLIASALGASPGKAQSSATPSEELARACPSEPMPMDRAQQALAACGVFLAKLPVGDATYADGLAARALLELNLNEMEPALGSAEAALGIVPDHLSAGTTKVEALSRLGRVVDARRDVERFLAIYPDNPRVRRQYAQLVALTSSPEETLTAMDRAIAVAPEDWQLRHERAALLMQLQRPDEALAELDFIIAKLPNDGFSIASRAQLRFEQGQYEGAVADFEKSKATGFLSNESDFLLARANLALGKLEPALAAIASASVDGNFSETNPMVLLYRFAILRRLGRSDEAQTVLATFTNEAGVQFVLRIQVFLRNIGMDEVQISGEFDETTKDELAACLMQGVCGGKMSEAI